MGEFNGLPRSGTVRAWMGPLPQVVAQCWVGLFVLGDGSLVAQLRRGVVASAGGGAAAGGAPVQYSTLHGRTSSGGMSR